MKTVDAFRGPQQTRPGCTHQLGCRCVAPYHLRPSTPIEEAREDFMRRPFIFGPPDEAGSSGNGGADAHPK